VTDVRTGKGREFGRETAGEGEGRRGTPARTLLFVRLSHFFNCFLYLHLFPSSIFLPIDLIHYTRHLCRRFRIDGINAMSRGISG